MTSSPSSPAGPKKAPAKAPKPAPSPATAKMTPDQIAASMAGVPQWTESAGEIHRTFQFTTFKEAMAFVDQVARRAEAEGHHPDILIRYAKVTLSLSTHDAGGITAKDFAMARALDELAPFCPKS